MLNDWINDFYSVEDTIDPNLADNEGNTSLIHAAQSGQHECLLVLLENFRPGLKTQLFWLKKRLQVSPWKGQSKSMRSTRLDFQHWWKQQFKDISIAFQHCLSMAPMMLLKTVERALCSRLGTVLQSKPSRCSTFAVSSRTGWKSIFYRTFLSVHTLWIQNGKSIETKIIHSIRNRARSISKSDGFGVIKALAEETINSSSPFSKIISIIWI